MPFVWHEHAKVRGLSLVSNHALVDGYVPMRLIVVKKFLTKVVYHWLDLVQLVVGMVLIWHVVVVCKMEELEQKLEAVSGEVLDEPRCGLTFMRRIPVSL